MKQKVIILILTMSLLLSGCSLFSRSYVSVEPHRESRQTVQTDVITASNYLELLGAMGKMIESGTEVAAIMIPDYPEDTIVYNMEMAIYHSKENDPIGSYAVDDIVYELGSSSGVPAVSVSISYHHNRSELQRIRRAKDTKIAEKIVAEALKNQALRATL